MDLPPPPPPIHDEAPERSRIAHEPSVQVPSDEPPSASDGQRPTVREESDVLPGDVELKFQLGFNGTRWDPLSLFTSFIDWYEFSITVDVATPVQWREWTLAVGANVYYSQPFFLELLSKRASNLQDVKFNWSMNDLGGTLRATAHYTGLATLDPYFLLAAGASAYTLRATAIDENKAKPERYHSPSVRIAMGGGVNSLLLKYNMVVGVELRYLIAAVFDRPDYLSVPIADGTVRAFELKSFHQPAHGFSWVLHCGYRF